MSGSGGPASRQRKGRLQHAASGKHEPITKISNAANQGEEEEADPEALQGEAVWLSQALQGSGGAEAGVSEGLQLLEGQADRHRLEGGQVMHHELAPLCQDHDGCGVIILIDGGFRRDLGPALNSPKPGDGVSLEMMGACMLALH